MAWMIDDLYPSMPWDKLDALVFDVGNVLLRFSPEDLLQCLLPDEPAIRRRLLVKMFRSPYWTMLDHGTISLGEAGEAMAGHEKELLGPIRHVLANWRYLKEPVEEGIEALRAAKAHGKACYVLSNYNAEAFQWIENYWDFFRLFDGMVISGRVRMLKPDPAIFRYLISTFSLNPGRTLFIDDAPINIEAALDLGLQGFCLNEAGKLRRFLGGE